MQLILLMPLKILKNRKSKNIHPFTVFVKIDYITGLGEIFGKNCLFDVEWRRGTNRGGIQEIPLDNSGDLRTYTTFKIPCHFTRESNSEDLDSKRLTIYLKKMGKKKSIKIAILQIDLANIVNKDQNTQPKQYTSTMKGIDMDIKPYIEFTSYAQAGSAEIVSSDQMSDSSFSNIRDKEAPIPTVPDCSFTDSLTSPIVASKEYHKNNINNSQNSVDSSNNNNNNNNNNDVDPFDFSFNSPTAAAANFLTEKSPTARRFSHSSSQDNYSSSSNAHSSSYGAPSGGGVSTPQMYLASVTSPPPKQGAGVTSPIRNDNNNNSLSESMKSPYIDNNGGYPAPNGDPYILSPVQSPIPPNSPMPERRMSTDDRKAGKKKGKRHDNLLQSLHRDNHTGFFSRRRHSISDPASSAQYRKELESRGSPSSQPSPFAGGESSTEDKSNSFIPIQSVLYSRSGDERLKFLNEEMILYKRPEYSEGVPVSSIIVYKCLFEWKEFNPHNHICLAKVMESLDYLSSMDNMDKETSCYWLSTSYGLWYLLDCTYNQRINSKHYAAEKSPNGDLSENTEFSNTTSAINLKLMFSALSQWIQENKQLNFFYYYKIEMSFLLQLLDIMMIDKNTLTEESVRKDICPSIGLTQLAILLITFTPNGCQEEVDPVVIKKLQDAGIRNQELQDTSINTDILFDLPENPEPSKRIFDVKIPPSVVPNKKYKFVFKPTMVY
ncbi:dilute domain-containing protein [Heterostelium album PN500]|uniref:Dilute domain-containing protein n=1 Tax=Heterostelium pallidum (strain ATCC 26659 / Pp 5 / PN500) TaxID=670386 RepID=D3BPN4_HETP5|nr:dilute domain-containing protein [Heterostelium album PN500]EFA76654.1 dilute domain-containing protein [Heterostelium album PN500]|eukprot:XP_020428786.1 dilute domain-containing protein [Heterostelium album PN500]